MGIDHRYTQEIVCPHCGYEHSDSWEMPDSSDNETCDECGEKYGYERDYDITYISVKIKEGDRP